MGLTVVADYSLLVHVTLNKMALRKWRSHCDLSVVLNIQMEHILTATGIRLGYLGAWIETNPFNILERMPTSSHETSSSNMSRSPSSAL